MLSIACVLVTEKDIVEDIACIYSLAIKHVKEGDKGSEESETSSKAIGTGQPF